MKEKFKKNKEKIPIMNSILFKQKIVIRLKHVLIYQIFFLRRKIIQKYTYYGIFINKGNILIREIRIILEAQLMTE